MRDDPLGKANDLRAILTKRRCKDCGRRTLPRRKLARESGASCSYCGAEHVVPAWFSLPWWVVLHIVSLPVGVFAIFYAMMSESAWWGYGVFGLFILGTVLLVFLVGAYVAPIKKRKHESLPAHEIPMSELLSWWRRK